VPEMQQAVANAYRGFLHEPEVTVTLKDFDKPYFLGFGEVARPGKYELRGTDRQRSGGDCGRIHAAGRHSQVVVFRRISAYVAESHVIDLKKMLDAHDLHEDLHLQAAILCMCRRADLENPQVCSDQRAELVYESIAVLDLVLEERSGSVHFASAKSGDSLKSCRS